MEILKFGLGIRFDLRKTGVFNSGGSEAAKEMIFGKLSENLISDDVKGMNLYAGEYKLTSSETDEIFTVVFSEGSHKRMSGIYKKLNSNAALAQFFAAYRPVIQTNLLRKAEKLCCYGKFDKNGVLIADGGTRLAFTVSAERGKPNRKRIDNKASDVQRSYGKRNIKIVLAPDKFKGSMSAETVAGLLSAAGKKIIPNADFIGIPIADGGEGTVNALVNACGGIKRSVCVTAPIGKKKVSAEYGMIYGDTAVIESAAASGLFLLNEQEKNPLEATSRGTGEIIFRALDEGAAHIIIGIGGSASDDGGMGAAAALGAKFLDEDGNELRGCGADMGKIHTLDLSNLDERLKKTDIKVICDVDNPLTGENGATYVYAPQKGADSKMLPALEAGMKNIERLYNAAAGCDVCSLPGSGAAGGLGAMLRTLADAKLVSGAEAILNAVHFDKALSDADLVITGEGMLDKTSAENGKAVGTAVRAANNRNIPAAVIAGCLGEGYESIYKTGNNIKVFAVSDKIPSQKELAEGAAERFFAAAEAMFRSIAADMGL